MVYVNATLFNDLDKITEEIIQSIYSDAINKINLNKLNCCLPNNGSFTIHGYYKRKFRIKENIVTINILRIKCEHCGKTHAVFFNDFIPYSSFSSIEGQMILLNVIDDSFTYEVINRINKIKRRILVRIALIKKNIHDKIEDLINGSVIAFCLHFLQIHRGFVASYLYEYS